MAVLSGTLCTQQSHHAIYRIINGLVTMHPCCSSLHVSVTRPDWGQHHLQFRQQHCRIFTFQNIVFSQVWSSGMPYSYLPQWCPATLSPETFQSHLAQLTLHLSLDGKIFYLHLSIFYFNACTHHFCVPIMAPFCTQVWQYSSWGTYFTSRGNQILPLFENRPLKETEKLKIMRWRIKSMPIKPYIHIHSKYENYQIMFFTFKIWPRISLITLYTKYEPIWRRYGLECIFWDDLTHKWYNDPDLAK